jgi:hypothetical protein
MQPAMSKLKQLLQYQYAFIQQQEAIASYAVYVQNLSLQVVERKPMLVIARAHAL